MAYRAFTKDRIEAASLQNLKGRNPIYASRFHRHGGDTTKLEPVSKIMQVLRESPESARGSGMNIRVRSRHMHRRVDIIAASFELTTFKSGWSQVLRFAMASLPFNS